MSWSDHDPGQGNPAAILGLAQLRRARAEKIRDAQRALRAAASASGAQWQAMSQTAFASKLTTHAADIELLATGLEAQASALQAYAGQVSQLQDRQRILEQQRSRARMDLGMAQLRLQSAGVELPSLLRSDTHDAAAVDDARRKTAAATSAVTDAESATRAIDAQWDQLISDRRAIDATCSAALQAERVLGQLAALSNTGVRTSSLTALLSLLGTLTSTDLRILDARIPGLTQALEKASPSEVAQWWDTLPADQREALISCAPSIIGALSGVPAADRVAANQENARRRLALAERELTERRHWGSSPGVDRQRKVLRDEIAYLRLATAHPPQVQLYLYDHANDRIVQMVGTPGPDTERVITYVPGTFADLNGFHAGTTQQIGSYLVQASRGSDVAFIYKDGSFPRSVLGEANDARFAQRSGATLARFQAGLLVQPCLKGTEQVAIGHSWGVANVTAAEVGGAHWDKVASLSGAGMPAAWAPSPETRYRDYSYFGDVLQVAQGLPGDHVWEGRNPRRDGFEHGRYYESPLSAGPIDRHNLVASDSPANQTVLDDLAEYVKAR